MEKDSYRRKAIQIQKEILQFINTLPHDEIKNNYQLLYMVINLSQIDDENKKK